MRRALIVGLLLWAAWALTSQIVMYLTTHNAAQFQLLLQQFMTNNLVRNASGMNWFEAQILLEGAMGGISILAAGFLVFKKDAPGIWLAIADLIITLVVVNLITFYFNQFPPSVLPVCSSCCWCCCSRISGVSSIRIQPGAGIRLHVIRRIDMTAVPYLDSYWVIREKFLAGQYPGDAEEETARRKVQSLIHAGIDCVIDLTQPGDSFFPYAKVLESETRDFGVQIERLNFPVPDFDVPPAGQMTRILDAIDQRLDQGKRVYVHCIGGIGRTGVTVACFLKRHGLDGGEALIELENLRKEAASWWRSSPESESQVEFVMKWEEGK
jgi:predicted protein tyrosine phosphatase